MNFLQLLLFRLMPTADKAKEILEDLRDDLRVYHDGVLLPAAQIEPELGGSIRNRALVVVIDAEGHDSEGEPMTRSFLISTRFKNDRSDSLDVDGVPMDDEDFEVHTKPLKMEVTFELGYKDRNLEKHLLKITNAKQ